MAYPAFPSTASPPGETFTYQFPVIQHGTYWYHSHSGFQEQTGLYGAIIIDPATPEPFQVDRDEVVLLSDWSDEDPQHLYATLKKLSHYYNFNERTMFDTLRDFRDKGVIQTFKDRHMWNSMRMSQSDLADITGYTYTYLMNGQSPNGNWTCQFKPGERIRLRFINASAMTFFDIRIPGLDMTVVAMDGQPVKPVNFHEVRLGVAETLDVIVEPKHDRAYTLFAQSIDRSGFARGTLTPDPAFTAEVPDMDEPPVLGHTEMGMGAMNHGGGNHGEMNHESMQSKSMDHSAMGHDMSAMAHGERQNEDIAHSRTAVPLPWTNPDLPPRNSAIEHPASEFGPGVDMRAMAPGDMLADPGIGLRDRPWKVLTYADMETLGSTPDNPIDSLQADREIVLHLTGNMDRYMWSFNGIKFADSVPLELFHHERVRITLVNDTMMTHPIHLHGLWSDLELGNGNCCASTPSPSNPARNSAIWCAPMPSVAGPITATCSITWRQACSGKCASLMAALPLPCQIHRHRACTIHTAKIMEGTAHENIDDAPGRQHHTGGHLASPGHE